MYVTVCKFYSFPPLFVPLSDSSGAQPQILTTSKALVLRVIDTMFGQNWARTFIRDVGNMNCYTPLVVPRGHTPPLCTNIYVHVLVIRVMHKKFDQN